MKIPDSVVQFLSARRIAVVGGCPMMYCGEVDIAHRCMCVALGWFGRVPR